MPANYTQITISPWGAANFADSLFVLIQIDPKTGLESFFDYKDYVILKDDFSEVRRDRDDTRCIIALESGLMHTIEFQPNDPYNPIRVFVGGVEPQSNEELRDLILAIIEPKYNP